MKRLAKKMWIVLLVAGSVTAIEPTAAVYADSVDMYQDTISLNGTVFSTPFGFVYNGTTYMPLFYVIRLLNQLGVQSTWNGAKGTWSLNTPSINSVSPLNHNTNAQQIDINGSFYVGMQSYTATDPSSGVNTSYIPIYDIQQVLDLLNVQNGWNGTTRAWTVSASDANNSGSSTAGNTTTSTTQSSSSSSTVDVTDLLNTVQADENSISTDEQTLDTDVGTLQTDVSTITNDYTSTQSDIQVMNTDITTLNNDANEGYDISGDAQSIYSDVQQIASDASGVLSDQQSLSNDIASMKQDENQLDGDYRTFLQDNAQLPSGEQQSIPSVQSWVSSFDNSVNAQISRANGYGQAEQQLVNESQATEQNVVNFAAQYQPAEYANTDNPLVAAGDLITSVVQGSWQLLETLTGNN